MPKSFKLFAGFVTICLLWGSSWAAVKIGLESIPPFLSLSLRYIFACVILGLIILLRKERIQFNSKFWKLVIILWLSSFTIPLALIYWAQSQISSGMAAILFATFPFWVAILSCIFLPNEKISFLKVVGIIIGFLGILLIFYNEFGNISTSQIMAMITIIITAIIQSIGLIALRKLSHDMNPVHINFIPILMSIVPILLISLIIEDYSNIYFDTRSSISILYLSIFCTVIAFIIYVWLVKYIEAVVLSTSAFINPLFAILIGVLVMKEQFTKHTYIGASLVLLGVIMVTIGSRIYEFINNWQK